MERVVLVGAGGFGRCWIQGLTARPKDFQVVGIVEPDPTAREVARRDFDLPGRRATSALDATLAKLGATLAIDSSPFPHRLHNAREVFGAGLDLIAAKPLGSSYAQASAIVLAASAHSRSLAVAQQMRYFPCFVALRDKIVRADLGRPRYVEVHMALDGRGWQPGLQWRLAMHNPLLMEAAIHHFDLMRWCLSSEIISVSAASWNPPWSPFSGDASAVAVLRTAGDVPILYTATFAPSPAEGSVRFDSGWRVVCDAGVLTVRDGGLYIDGDDTIVQSTTDPTSLEELNGVLLDKWLQARENEVEPDFSGRDNLRSMLVLERAVRSVRKE